MFLPNYLPQDSPVLQWAKDHNWRITWTRGVSNNTLTLERGSHTMSFTLPFDVAPAEWEAILTTWQKQNDPS